MERAAKDLWIDQYNQVYFANTVKELRKEIDGGGARVSKMYLDRKDKVLHIGYVIGTHWLSRYRAVEATA